MESSARNGKIARLPRSVRTEVNTRLDNGETGPKIIGWLHTLPEVLAVLDEHFHEEPISPQNLSEWRKGGYAEWLKRKEQLENTKELANYSLQLASLNGGNTTEGAAAIAGGQLLSIFESLDVDAQTNLLKEKPATYLGLVDALARLQKSQADSEKAKQSRRVVEQNDRRLAQSERKIELDEARFRRTTAELFLKFYADKKAAEIAEGKGRKEAKIDQLVLHMWGPAPAPKP